MRATMRITWLLLSLSFLFHSVCSEEGQSDTSVSKSVTAGTPTPNGGDPPMPSTSNDGNTIGTPTVLTLTTGKTSETTQTPTPAKSTAVVTTVDSSSVAASEATNASVAQQSQAATTDKPAVLTITTTDSTPTRKQDPIPTVDTLNQPQLTTAETSQLTPAATSQLTPVATSSSKSGVEVSDNPDAVQTSEASGSTKPSGTEVPVTVQQPTTMITKTPAGGAAGQQSLAHTTSTSETNQDDSEGGIQNKTGTATSPVQTASSAPSPAGNPGTTSTPSILTTAGPSVTGSSDTKTGTTSLQTTPTPTKATTPPSTTITTASTTTTATTAPKTFKYSLNNGHENKEEKELVELCKWLLVNLQDGNCSLTWRDSNGTKKFEDVKITGIVKGELVSQHYEDIVKKPADNKTLIAILASCGALLIMIVILAVCASHHRKPYNENQQHLTDELHTVENGYHDNPTLEVMEAQPEMQEKKMVLNGEFNDSWIVPMDNLLKEDMPDEEDTHL
ncbi:podocalyxin isoform X2 [Acanthopagrus latus]|uniref:podocalyxin isoform X2 n=1 Tax=Acanthopagrus latus TaxID=8177 RepID=UPI00187C20A6|nr:podocalyxin isoform X2 [Acanthopagrus latus]